MIEASTDSEWVARCLEALGHEVIGADPNFAPMCATRSRTVKTDRRDALALAEACLLGAYRPAHRRSDPPRHVRGCLLIRDAIVRTALDGGAHEAGEDGRGLGERVGRRAVVFGLELAAGEEPPDGRGRW